MIAPTLAEYLDRLESSARSASVAEEELRRELTRRVAELERERQFAYRRCNLMRAVVSAVGDAAEREEAVAKGTAAFMRELGWTGASERRRLIIERFEAVVLAVWQAARSEEGRPSDFAAIDAALAEFERWFAEQGNGPFLTLLEPEMEVIPLVEC